MGWRIRQHSQQLACQDKQKARITTAPTLTHQNESLDWQSEPEQPLASPPNSRDFPAFLYILLQSCAAVLCAISSSSTKVPRPIQPVQLMVLLWVAMCWVCRMQSAVAVSVSIVSG